MISFKKKLETGYQTNLALTLVGLLFFWKYAPRPDTLFLEAPPQCWPLKCVSSEGSARRDWKFLAGPVAVSSLFRWNTSGFAPDGWAMAHVSLPNAS